MSQWLDTVARSPTNFLKRLKRLNATAGSGAKWVNLTTGTAEVGHLSVRQTSYTAEAGPSGLRCLAMSISQNWGKKQEKYVLPRAITS